MLKQLSSAVAAVCSLVAPAAAQVPEPEPPPPTCRCLYADYLPAIVTTSTTNEAFYGISYTNHTDVGLDSVDIHFWESDGTRWSPASSLPSLFVHEKHTFLMMQDRQEGYVTLTRLPDDNYGGWRIQPDDPSLDEDSFGRRQSSMLIRACAESPTISGRFTGTLLPGSRGSSGTLVALTEMPNCDVF